MLDWLCPSTGHLTRCVKSFGCCMNQQHKAEHIHRMVSKEFQVEISIRWTHKIGAMSYAVFGLILMLAIVLAPFAIISASCSLLQLPLAAGLGAWLQNTTSLKCLKGSWRRSEATATEE